MTPFLTFRSPDTAKWVYQPKGRKKFKLRIWVLLPGRDEPDENEVIVHEPILLSEFTAIMHDQANEIIDLAQCELYQHWAAFLLNVDDSTSDEEIDQFYDNFPVIDYGYECFIWR